MWPRSDYWEANGIGRLRKVWTSHELEPEPSVARLAGAGSFSNEIVPQLGRGPIGLHTSRFGI